MRSWVALRHRVPGSRSIAAGLAVVISVVTFAGFVGSAAAADVSYRRTTLTASVTGTSVSVSTVIVASSQVRASKAGVCARSTAGAHHDFPMGAAVITTTGTALTATAKLPAGGYRYFSCLQVNGQWFRTGVDQTFTVSGAVSPTSTPTVPSSTTTSPPAAVGNPGGVAMPVGNSPGWVRVFEDDFVSSVARGAFPGPYASKWASYHGFSDTYEGGTYNQGILSASGGALDIYLHSQNGRPQVAAPVPLVTGKWGGQSYGRFSVRFNADPVPGYKAAWLLWPDSNNWNDGEIDFPEGSLDGTMWGFHHCVGQPTSNCYWLDTKVAFTGWHTATVEWTPGKLVYLLDGRVMGSTTNRVPTAPLHWVLQTETDHVPDAASSGHVLIDWVTIDRYQP